jgi:transposase
MVPKSLDELEAYSIKQLQVHVMKRVRARNELIWRLHQAGTPTAEIAKMVDLHPTSVGAVIHRVKRYGLDFALGREQSRP